MYPKSAQVYDLLYARNDYPAQSQTLLSLIREHEAHPSETLLDVACGTGLHLEQLQKDFVVSGVDLVPEMLAQAHKRCPAADLQVGDMRSFDLGKQFDVVTCLFSAIGYMHTPDDLTTALRTMANHITPGGLLMVEPWLHPENVRPPKLHVETAEGDGIAVTRMNLARQEGHLLTFDFHYMIGTNEAIESFTEFHTVALYTDDEYRAAFAAAGLDVLIRHAGLIGRGLYIARKK